MNKGDGPAIVQLIQCRIDGVDHRLQPRFIHRRARTIGERNSTCPHTSGSVQYQDNISFATRLQRRPARISNQNVVTALYSNRIVVAGCAEDQSFDHRRVGRRGRSLTSIGIGHRDTGNHLLNHSVDYQVAHLYIRNTVSQVVLHYPLIGMTIDRQCNVLTNIDRTCTQGSHYTRDRSRRLECLMEADVVVTRDRVDGDVRSQRVNADRMGLTGAVAAAVDIAAAG